MTREAFNESVNAEIRRIMESAREENCRENWPTVEEQEEYWLGRDEGRSGGYGESYAERNT